MDKVLNSDQPLVGFISALGGSYSVRMKATKNCSSMTTGYGDFPYDKYPNIPVVDFRNANIGMVLSLPYITEAYAHHFYDDHVPLEQYLKLAKQAGATIHQLTIHSLHDAQADCTCGFHYVLTGEATKQEIIDMHNRS